MDFVLMLHSHLPYVLNHGRWPHGSDWISEAAIDTYLPLLEILRGLEADGVPAPVTIGFTPVLANQLANPLFAAELEAFLTQRLEACDQADVELPATGDAHLVPLVSYWRERFTRFRNLFRSVGGNLVQAYRELESAGRLEIVGSAATHGFLPLLARDESIRLQLALGVAEHRRLFGRAPQGCWLPECAYRPRGPWHPWPSAPHGGIRRGIEEHLVDAGFRYFFVDAHLAAAGRPLGVYGDPITGPRESYERLSEGERSLRSPYHAYRVSPTRGTEAVAAYVRDPRASMQVWSRQEGYPGEGRYLEFHKIRWPGGLKLWRVTGGHVDLGGKDPYHPALALQAVASHAHHFQELLGRIAAARSPGPSGVIVAPFDTELFGHWWFEGPDFLGAVYRELAGVTGVRPITGSRHLKEYPARAAIRLPTGTWGANGDYTMWLSDLVAWTWERLWPLEARFWDTAPEALGDPTKRPVLAAAARQLLLAQASDWQFIISTGHVADYAVRRFVGHCEDAERLVAALASADGVSLEEGQQRSAELDRRDQVFPDVLPAISAALSGSRSIAIG
ncbi:MAG TPA: 1,4-alpha-glucan branching protein domain-containing protein [Gemmatimonadales bacterium]|nr:1,4-alpha-glucan branching protein domain-containing protein [Gemmatimonadales bacterium]